MLENRVFNGLHFDLMLFLGCEIYDKRIGMRATGVTEVKNWYLIRNQERYGPYTWDELCGYVQKQDLVWGPGYNGWTPATEVHGLLSPGNLGNKRKKSIGLIALITSFSLLIFFIMPIFLISRCSQIFPGRVELAYPFDYEINASNEGFFLDPDSFELLMAAGPFYAGQKLPFDHLDTFEQARRDKVDSILDDANDLVRAVWEVEDDIEEARIALFNTFDNIGNEPGIEELVQATVIWQAALQSESEWLSSVLDALAEHEEHDAYVRSHLDYLYVVRAVEYASLSARSMDHLVTVAALIIIENEDSDNENIRHHLERLDSKMSKTDTIATRMENIFLLTELINAGIRQLYTADLFITADIMQFIHSRIDTLRDKLLHPVTRERLDTEELELVNEYLDDFEFLSKQLLLDLEKELGMELPDRHNVQAVPASAGGVSAYDLTQNMAQTAMEVLLDPQELEAERRRQLPWYARAWDGIKRDVGNTVRTTRDIVGVTVDTAGAVVYSASRAGFGMYYGNEWEDISSDISEDFNRVYENHKNGVSGVETWNRASAFFDTVEQMAGEGWQAIGEMAFGDRWPARAMGAFGKMSVGTFTALGQGISRIANHESTAADVALGSLEIGLSLIGGSSSIFKASQGTRVVTKRKLLRTASWLARNPRVASGTAAGMARTLKNVSIRNIRNIDITRAMSTATQNIKRNMRTKYLPKLRELQRANYAGNINDIYKRQINLNILNLLNLVTSPTQTTRSIGSLTVDIFDMCLNGWVDDIITDSVVGFVGWLTDNPQESTEMIENVAAERMSGILDRYAEELAERLIERQYPDIEALMADNILISAEEFIPEIERLIEEIVMLREQEESEKTPDEIIWDPDMEGIAGEWRAYIVIDRISDELSAVLREYDTTLEQTFPGIQVGVEFSNELALFDKEEHYRYYSNNFIGYPITIEEIDGLTFVLQFHSGHIYEYGIEFNETKTAFYGTYRVLAGVDGAQIDFEKDQILWEGRIVRSELIERFTVEQLKELGFPDFTE